MADTGLAGHGCTFEVVEVMNKARERKEAREIQKREGIPYTAALARVRQERMKPASEAAVRFLRAVATKPHLRLTVVSHDLLKRPDEDEEAQRVRAAILLMSRAVPVPPEGMTDTRDDRDDEWED